MSFDLYILYISNICVFLKTLFKLQFLTNFNRTKEVTEMKSNNKILNTTKRTPSFLSVNIELNGKRTNKAFTLFCIQAAHIKCSRVRSPCLLFLIFLFATRTSCGNYFTTLRIGIKIYHK